MNEPSPDAKRKEPDSGWNPVIMSVVVFPGIGQWMQRRQTAACAYMAFFTIIIILFGLISYRYFREVIEVLRQALDGTLEDGASFPPIAAILKPFGVVLFIYFANVVDVLRGRIQLRNQKRDAM